MSWTLAIDFGTSRTTAAIAEGDSVEQLEIDDSKYMPSLVCLDDDGRLFTGQRAARTATLIPERTERVPKRAVLLASHVLLGDRRTEVTDLIAAVLNAVAKRAIQRKQGVAPSRLVLTHPVEQESLFLKALTAAAARAELPSPEFVSEPVAAALWYAYHDAHARIGDLIGVFDFGGGTLDVAVLRRTHNGFFLVGPPGGDPHLGGEDVDAVLHHLVANLCQSKNSAVWESVFDGPFTDHNRRDRAVARANITTAKHELSEDAVTNVDLRGGTSVTAIRVTRGELNTAMADVMDRAADVLRHTLKRSEVEADQLTTLYLTGGSSRIPLVHDAIHHALGIKPRLDDDPKSIVVLGAARWALNPPRVASNASEAQAGYQKLVTERTRDLGAEHADTLAARCEVARYTGEAGDVKGAVALLKTLLNDQKAVLDSGDRAILKTKALFGAMTSRSGFPAQAAQIFAELRRESVLPDDDPDIIDVRAEEACCIGRGGEWGQAVELLKAVTADSSRIRGEDHPDTLEIRYMLADALYRTDANDESLAVYEKLWRAAKAQLGEDHETTLYVLSGKALVVAALGDTAQASNLFKDVIPKLERVRGADDPGVLTARLSAALFTGRLGAHEDSIAELTELLSRTDSIRGENSPMALLYRIHLTEILWLADKRSEALSVLKEVIVDCERYLEPGHSYTVWSRQRLAKWTAD